MMSLMLNKQLILSIFISVMISLGVIYATLMLFGLKMGSNQDLSPIQPAPVENQPTDTGISQLDSRLTTLEEKIDELTASQAADSTVNETKPAPAVIAPATNFDPQVIYLGTASTTQREWTDTGVEITLNSANYPIGTTARFEAGLSIIGGEAWARLKNKSTGMVLESTAVSHNTSTTTWKGSTRVGLHFGENTYVVQLKSSSGETARLDGARIILE